MMTGDLTPSEIETVLKHNYLGRIGCHANGRTYVVPIGYAFDGEYILSYAADGLKVSMMRSNPEVCFEVDHYSSLTNWRSVICWGRYDELAGGAAEKAKRILVDRFSELSLSESNRLTFGQREVLDSAKAGHPKDAVIYRIRLTERTGRYELV
jgi:nitroimidazol reductase NimA-like FMN-containing flavoprotein (pyridoxamine 5'-phosphate oxidase superfamily)